MMDIDTDKNIFTPWDEAVIKSGRAAPGQKPLEIHVAREKDLILKKKMQDTTARLLKKGPRAEKHMFRLASLGYKRSFLRWSVLLPDDVIVSVFEQGTFCSPENSRAPLMPVIYASVCKRWRHLALSTTVLWGVIEFDDKKPYNLTKLFLARSRGAPLYISIDTSDDRFDFGDDELWPPVKEMTDHLALFLPHSRRWGSFECITDHWAFMQATLRALRGLATPILTTLDLNQNWDVSALDPAIGQPIRILQGGAPALRRLNLSTISRIEWNNMAFTNLSELALTHLMPDQAPSYRNFWSMLNRSPNLKSLTLVGQGPTMDLVAASQLPRVNLRSLEIFEFLGSEYGLGLPPQVYYSLDYVMFILSSFKPGPALHSLSIGGFETGDDILKAVPSLRDFAHVKRLLLSSIDFTPKTATRWLSEMPEINHLEITVGSVTQSGVIGALVAKPSARWGGVLCPLLTSFGPLFLDFESISDLVGKRLRYGVGLRTLVFDINAKPYIGANLDGLRGKVEICFQGEVWGPDDGHKGPDLTRFLPEGVTMEEMNFDALL